MNDDNAATVLQPLTIMITQRFLWATACAALLGLAGYAS